MVMILTQIIVALCLSKSPVDSVTDSAALDLAIQAKEAALHWKTGRILLPGAKAKLDLPAGFRYLDSADARVVLEDLWGNPAGAGTLGMVFGPGQSLNGDSSWGVVVTYVEDGHVNDQDAGFIDYGNLLEEMRRVAQAGNVERVRQGFAPVHLVGWAERPTYDRSSKKLFWARELDFGTPHHTLNYNVRVLGRVGVLNLNAVSSMVNLGVVQSGMHQLLPGASFTPGNAYSDFDSGKDRMSAFGIANLVAGGAAVAAKASIFGDLASLLFASKGLLLVLGLLSLAALIRLWTLRRKVREEDSRFGQEVTVERKPQPR